MNVTPKTAPKKPVALRVALTSGLMCTASAFFLAANSFMTGADWVRTALAKELGIDAERISASLIETSATDVLQTLKARAYVWIVLGIFMLLVSIAGRRSALWSRILRTLIIMPVLVMAAIDLGDTVPTVNSLMAALAASAALVSVFACWIPSRK
ncbi:hypothetical protein [Streptomyces sp. NPDC096153]|uniref:hypothetical protein n=1 Tax=Streptomyces sp. NPDC096153 TaxID=3155548 RepID=UPI0033289C07